MIQKPVNWFACSANQLTGLYMMVTLAFNELRDYPQRDYPQLFQQNFLPWWENHKLFVEDALLTFPTSKIALLIEFFEKMVNYRKPFTNFAQRFHHRC